MASRPSHLLFWGHRQEMRSVLLGHEGRWKQEWIFGTVGLSAPSLSTRCQVTELFTWSCVCVYLCCEMCACILSHFSGVQLLVTQWTIDHQASPFIGLSRHRYWSGLSCHPQGDLPDPGIEPMSLTSPALAGRFFITSATWEELWDMGALLTLKSRPGALLPGA